MPVYPSKPAIGWIDLSQEDLRRARDLLANVQEEGVLDELGFGVLQNAIADQLYPATTTGMTRSRYLYFIPAIYRLLERRRVSSANVDREARKLQDELRAVLAGNEDRWVIGESAKEKIIRPPSNIYWSALRKLGIFLAPLSEAAYQTRFDTIWEERRSINDDDRSPHPLPSYGSFWDQDLPPPDFLNEKDLFIKETGFCLTRGEAKDLRRRYKDLQTDIMPSLLVYLVEHEVHDLPYPWSAPHPPESLRALLRHAEALSAFARGTTLQYYHILLQAREAAKLSVPENRVESAFERWWETARGILSQWDRTAFFTMQVVAKALRGDQPFINQWTDAFLHAARPRPFLLDRAIRNLVRARERKVKPYKARLWNTAYLKQWEPPELNSDDDSNTYELWYRHRIGQRFVGDIVSSLQ